MAMAALIVLLFLVGQVSGQVVDGLDRMGVFARFTSLPDNAPTCGTVSWTYETLEYTERYSLNKISNGVRTNLVSKVSYDDRSGPNITKAIQHEFTWQVEDVNPGDQLELSLQSRTEVSSPLVQVVDGCQKAEPGSSEPSSQAPSQAPPEPSQPSPTSVSEVQPTTPSSPPTTTSASETASPVSTSPSAELSSTESLVESKTSGQSDATTRLAATSSYNLLASSNPSSATSQTGHTSDTGHSSETGHTSQTSRTSETGQPTSLSSAKDSQNLAPGALAGLVVGIVVALLVAGLAIWFCIRRRRNRITNLKPQVDIDSPNIDSRSFRSSDLFVHPTLPHPLATVTPIRNPSVKSITDAEEPENVFSAYPSSSHLTNVNMSQMPRTAYSPSVASYEPSPAASPRPSPASEPLDDSMLLPPAYNPAWQDEVDDDESQWDARSQRQN